MFFLFFFFSSRRRHTRFDCDWSSDVCSSDLSPVTKTNRLATSGRPLTSCSYIARPPDRKSTRLNSSHSQISYAVFCLKKKKYSKTLRPHTTLAQTRARAQAAVVRHSFPLPAP